ncbi:MAG TPA: hypothetical protein PKO06_23020, partial [Candidatus Ozemobacteraceae bacterium]|nr:hypothetical protein [Candidatus Ozemobacteraceae bacterium]
DPAPMPDRPLREPLPGGPYEPGFPAIIAGVGGCMVDASHLKAGLRLTLQPGETAQINGQAVYLPEPGQEISIHGRSQGIFTRGALLWHNGDAELSFKLVKPFRVVLGDSFVTIRGTVIHFKGEVQGSVQIQLLSGVAELTTPRGVRLMTVGETVDVRQMPTNPVPRPVSATPTPPIVSPDPSDTTTNPVPVPVGESIPTATGTGVSSVTLQGNPYEDAPVVVPGSQ